MGRGINVNCCDFCFIVIQSSSKERAVVELCRDPKINRHVLNSHSSCKLFWCAFLVLREKIPWTLDSFDAGSFRFTCFVISVVIFMKFSLLNNQPT